jgi:hypothetical protein
MCPYIYILPLPIRASCEVCVCVTTRTPQVQVAWGGGSHALGGGQCPRFFFSNLLTLEHASAADAGCVRLLSESWLMAENGAPGLGGMGRYPAGELAVSSSQAFTTASSAAACVSVLTSDGLSLAASDNCCRTLLSASSSV